MVPMERREPTFSTSNLNDPTEAAPRRSQVPPASKDDTSAPRRHPTATSAAPTVAQAPSSSLPAIALVVALLAAAGAGFLGWQLFQAQAQIKLADGRIQTLEQQLNLTSNESSASLVALQANLKKLDSELRTSVANVEANRKAIASALDKIAAVGRDAAAGKKEANDAKSGLNALKQDVETNKSLADASAAKIDTAGTSIAQQQQALQNLKESLAKLELELVDLDSLTRRTKANEDAISAIDDYRRTTNREILQIKQQLGLAPKQ